MTRIFTRGEFIKQTARIALASGMMAVSTKLLRANEKSSELIVA
jgi:hypothetical protein